jgi:hypothetical protein
MAPKKKKPTEENENILPDFYKIIERNGMNYSFRIADDLIRDILISVDDEIRIRKTLKKLPEYNVEY